MIAFIDDIMILNNNFETLNENECVDDSIIHFFCKYQQKYNDEKNNSNLFLTPCQVQLLQRTNSDINILNFFNFKNYTNIFMPISNLTQSNSAHWSLFLWSRGKKNLFLHFDSNNHFNLLFFEKFSNSLKKSLNLKNVYKKIIKSPIQNNITDCGIYLMAIMDDILTKNKVSKSINLINSQYINKFRILLKEFIKIYNNNEFISWENLKKKKLI